MEQIGTNFFTYTMTSGETHAKYLISFHSMTSIISIEHRISQHEALCDNARFDLEVTVACKLAFPSHVESTGTNSGRGMMTPRITKVIVSKTMQAIGRYLNENDNDR